MAATPIDKSTEDTNPITIPAAAAAIMLLGALGGWPYSYFVLLRWVVCIAAIFVTYKASEWNHQWALWSFGFLAILFNPLMPIHLTRELWKPIDIASAVMFAIALVKVRP